MTINQIKHQLDRLVPVDSVEDLTTDGPSIEREMALIKVEYDGHNREEVIRLFQTYKLTQQKTLLFLSLQGLLIRLIRLLN